MGRKRHLLTDTIGMLLAVIVHPASVQDRDGAEPLLRQARRLFPFVERIIGDAGYQGPKMAAAVARTGTWKMEIVRRCDRHHFVVLPKRWIVERTIGWISRNRRLARDFERHCRIAAAFVRMAMIRIMLRGWPQSPQREPKLPGWALRGADPCLAGASTRASSSRQMPLSSDFSSAPGRNMPRPADPSDAGDGSVGCRRQSSTSRSGLYRR